MLFWLASGANMYAYTLDAPYTAAQNVILQPLPAHLRTQAQTTAMGIAYPLATGISGLLLLFLLNVLDFDSVQLSYAILIVLAALVVRRSCGWAGLTRAACGRRCKRAALAGWVSSGRRIGPASPSWKKP